MNFDNNAIETTDLQREEYLGNSQASIAEDPPNVWTLVDHKRGDSMVLIAKDRAAALHEACEAVIERRAEDTQ